MVCPHGPPTWAWWLGQASTAGSDEPHFLYGWEQKFEICPHWDACDERASPDQESGLKS